MLHNGGKDHVNIVLDVVHVEKIHQCCHRRGRRRRRRGGGGGCGRGAILGNNISRSRVLCKDVEQNRKELVHALTIGNIRVFSAPQEEDVEQLLLDIGGLEELVLGKGSVDVERYASAKVVVLRRRWKKKKGDRQR